LVGTANIRCNDLEDDPVIDRFSCWISEGRKIYMPNFDPSGFEINDTTIGRHLIFLLLFSPRRTLNWTFRVAAALKMAAGG
jgi:hypothetical protein